MKTIKDFKLTKEDSKKAEKDLMGTREMLFKTSKTAEFFFTEAGALEKTLKEMKEEGHEYDPILFAHMFAHCVYMWESKKKELLK